MSGLQIIGRLERKRAAARSTGLVGRASRPQSTRLRAALYLRELRDKQLENPRKKRDNELL